MENLIQAIGMKQDMLRVIALTLLIFARLVFAVFFTPFMGGRNVPARIKMGLAFALAVILVPALARTLPEPLPLGAGALVALFLKEAFIGLLIGLTISMVFYGIQGAGQFIDNQRGVSTAAIFNPALGNQASLTANFLFQLSIVLFFVIGGHRVYLTALFQSFEILPVVSYPKIHAELQDPSMRLAVRVMGNVFLIAIQLSAPVVIAEFLVEVVLGIANRVAPQMDVQFLSYTLKAMVALVILFAGLHIIVWQLDRLLEQHLGWVKELVKGLPGL